MEIFDLQPWQLCKTHLLSQHRVIHKVWNHIQTPEHKRSPKLSTDPECCRWEANSLALFRVHLEITNEMHRREMKHSSPLEGKTIGDGVLREFLTPIDQQMERLNAKDCGCPYRRSDASNKSIK